MNLDEVLGEKGLEKILREEKWRVEKMMKLKRNGVEEKSVEVGEDGWNLENMDEVGRQSPFQFWKKTLKISRNKEIS